MLQRPALQGARRCPSLAYHDSVALRAAPHRTLVRTHPTGPGPASPLPRGLPSRRQRLHPREALPEEQQRAGTLRLCRQHGKVKGSRKLSSLLLPDHNFPVFKGVPNGTTGLTACALASLGSALGFYFWV